jgi:hypothetical protein
MNRNVTIVLVRLSQWALDVALAFGFCLFWYEVGRIVAWVCKSL